MKIPDTCLAKTFDELQRKFDWMNDDPKTQIINMQTILDYLYKFDCTDVLLDCNYTDPISGHKSVVNVGDKIEQIERRRDAFKKYGC